MSAKMMTIKYILKGLYFIVIDWEPDVFLCKFVNLEFSHTQMNNLDQDNEDQEEGGQ